MMSQWLAGSSLNQRLALLAFVLGVVAIGATPTRQGTVTVSPQDLALIVQRGADDVSARTLADRLIAGQADFRIIDLRADAAAYAAYHIPTAENIPIAALANADLPRNDKLLLYAEDGVHAAQAWFLLRAQGYRGAYMLRGGLAGWKDQVLHPVLAEAVTVEQRRENEQRAAVAAYFGGAPRSDNQATGGTASGSGAMPAGAALATPAATGPATPAPTLQLPAAAARPKPVVKKKEGC